MSAKIGSLYRNKVAKKNGSKALKPIVPIHETNQSTEQSKLQASINESKAISVEDQAEERQEVTPQKVVAKDEDNEQSKSTQKKVQIQLDLPAPNTQSKTVTFDGIYCLQIFEGNELEKLSKTEEEEIIKFRVSEWNTKYPLNDGSKYARNDDAVEFHGTSKIYSDPQEDDPIYKSYLIQYSNEYLGQEGKFEAEGIQIRSLRDRLDKAEDSRRSSQH